MRILKHTNVDFIGLRKKSAILSAILIFAGLVSVGIHKGFDTSIDFAGGTLVEIGFTNEVPLQEVRDAIDAAGFAGAEVTHFGSNTDILIKVKAIGDPAEASREIERVLKETWPDVDMRRVESVGPKIGSELKTAAFWAIIYSLFGIVVYIGWRFQFRFAIAAIIALVHDVLFTLGFFSVAGLELSIPVIAGILTVVGYSLNDTIVVFDRIRENLKTQTRDESFGHIADKSLRQTMSRSINTSISTLFTLVALYVLGTESIRIFVFALIIGILVGTYSSIFIASPVLTLWQERRRLR